MSPPSSPHRSDRLTSASASPFSLGLIPGLDAVRDAFQIGGAPLRATETAINPFCVSKFGAATVVGLKLRDPVLACPLPSSETAVPLPALPEAIADLVARGVAEPSVLASVQRLASDPELLSAANLRQFSFVILGAGSQVCEAGDYANLFSYPHHPASTYFYTPPPSDPSRLQNSTPNTITTLMVFSGMTVAADGTCENAAVSWRDCSRDRSLW